MPFALAPEDRPRGDALRPGGHERVYLARTAAYELALVTAPAGPPLVHLRFVGQRRTLVLRAAEWEAFAATVTHLRDYLRQDARCRRSDSRPRPEVPPRPEGDEERAHHDDQRSLTVPDLDVPVDMPLAGGSESGREAGSPPGHRVP